MKRIFYLLILISLAAVSQAQKVHWTVAQVRTSLAIPRIANFYVHISDKGMEGDFKLDATDYVSSDNTGLTIVDAYGDRWKRVYSGEVQATWFGVKADGINKDSSSMSLAINTVNNMGGGVIRMPAGTLYFGGVRLPANSAGLKIYGQARGATVIKVQLNAPRAFDLYSTATASTAVTFQNITLSDFTVDAQSLYGYSIAPMKAVTGSVTSAGGWTDVNIGDNSQWGNAAVAYLKYTNTGTAALGGGRNAVRQKAGSTTTIQLFLNAGETVNAGDSVSGANDNHVIVGTQIDAQTIANANGIAPYYNCNFNNITVENVNIINGVTENFTGTFGKQASTSTYGISLYSRVNPSYSGTLFSTNINIRNVDMDGVTNGVFIGSLTSATVMKIFLDNIYLKNVTGRSNIVPAAQFVAEGFLIGNSAFCNRVTVEDCSWDGSGDVGLEVDNAMNYKAVRCNFRNCYGSGFFSYNYSYPATSIAGTPTATVSNGGTIASGATTFTINAFPATVAQKGYLVIDNELMYYTYNGTTTLTVYRGLNNTAAVSHNDGTTVYFFEAEKQSYVYEKCSFTNDNMVSTQAEGWRASRNSILPAPRIKLKECSYTRTGGTAGHAGEAIFVSCENTLFDIDGMDINIAGIDMTATNAVSNIPIQFINNDYGTGGPTVAATPPQRLIFRRLNMNVDGKMNNNTTSTTNQHNSIFISTGNYYIDWSSLNFKINLSTTSNTQKIFNLYFAGSGNLYATGKVDGMKVSAVGDGSPLPIYMNQGTDFMGKFVVDNIDLSDLSYTVTANNVNYTPIRVNATSNPNVTIRTIIPPKIATTPINSNWGKRITTATSYTANFEDRYIAVTGQTGAVTITLPLIETGNGNYKPNYANPLLIADEGYNAATNSITITPGTAEKINNSTASVTINSNGGFIYLMPGPSGWRVLGGTLSTAGVSGSATLVSGTVTVSTTAVTANSKIFIQLKTPSGTLGAHYQQGTITAGTSFVINSVSTAGATVTTDASTVNWWIIN
jgi:hypothetical protein